MFVQIIMMSSIYLFRMRGLIGCVAKNLFSTMDIKMFAMVGENGAPIAVPSICWKTSLSNVK